MISIQYIPKYIKGILKTDVIKNDFVNHLSLKLYNAQPTTKKWREKVEITTHFFITPTEFN